MTQPRGPEPQAPNPDAGVVFRAEMWLTNFFLGYWPVLVGVIVAVLLGVLVYGQASSYLHGQQRRIADEISVVEQAAYDDILAGLPEDLRMQVQQASMNYAFLRGAPLALEEVVTGIELTEEQLQRVEEAGDELLAIGREASGTAAIEARLKASELYRITDATDKRREALQLAADATESLLQRDKAPLRYAAQGGLANLELEQGEGDSAVARLRTLSEELDGYLAEQATLDLGLVLEHLERDLEAQTVYAGFDVRWPDSPRIEEIQARLERLQAGGTAPAAPEGTLPMDQGTVVTPQVEEPE